MRIDVDRRVKPRVVLLGNVRLLREGLGLALRARREIAFVDAQPANPAGVSALLEGLPDILLADTGSGDLRELVALVHDRAPSARTIALLMGDEERVVVRCAEAGVAGYVGLEESVEDLIGAILRVHRGEFASSLRVASILGEYLRGLRRPGEYPPIDAARSGLTSREQEVTTLIERGLSNKEIARELHIGLSTVKNHVHNILGKSAVTTRAQLTDRRGIPLPART